jgi:hypothetical protein
MADGLNNTTRQGEISASVRVLGFRPTRSGVIEGKLWESPQTDHFLTSSIRNK